jgi:integrase
MPKKSRTRNLNGMGNIYKTKDGRYEYRLMEDGELRFVSAKTQSELQEKIKRLNPVPAGNQKVKFYDWMDTYLEVYVKTLRKKGTYESYKYTWEHYIKPYIRDGYLKNKRTIDFQGIIAKQTERGMSESTLNNIWKVLNVAFKQAVEDKVIFENPIEGLKIPSVQKKAKKVLKVDELNRIFKYLETSRWYWPMHFLLYTGLRRGEFLGLKWSDLDYNEHIITVSDNLTDSGIGSTKESKVHYAPLSDKAIHCLAEFKKQLQAEANPACFQNESNIIFVSQRGTPMRPQSFNNVFRRIREDLGIHASPHSMRHTFVYYNKNKLSLSELKDALGHEDTTSTLDIYGNMLGDTNKVASKIDETYDELEGEMDEKKKAVGSVVDFNAFKKHRK